MPHASLSAHMACLSYRSSCKDQLVQREVVARLHEDLSSSTERLQAELAEWQGRCESLEAELQAEHKQGMQLEQALKARPTSQQVYAIDCGLRLHHSNYKMTAAWNLCAL